MLFCSSLALVFVFSSFFHVYIYFFVFSFVCKKFEIYGNGNVITGVLRTTFIVWGEQPVLVDLVVQLLL